MKAIFINGSPRKGQLANTSNMLLQAMKGAEEAGAEVQMVDLYDLKFTGCRSCFACKVKNARTHGACAYPDDLKPVMQAVMEADVLVIGTPVYFGTISAQMNLFWERLFYPVVTYISDGPYQNKLDLPKPKRCAMIVTMGCSEEYFEPMGYKQHFDQMGQRLGMTMGNEPAQMLYMLDTYQFRDYSKMAISVDRADPVKKAQWRDEHYEQDLQRAYELGRQLLNFEF